MTNTAPIEKAFDLPKVFLFYSVLVRGFTFIGEL